MVRLVACGEYWENEGGTDFLNLVAIISRVILAMFWFAIQTVNGGDVVEVMITAIWPSFARLHNGIPESQGITTPQMVSFFLCESNSTIHQRVSY